MALLIVFGFLAGAATAVSPCALPVLPVVFAAGSTGGRRRPAGIATGLALSFTFATVLLVYLISALGLPDDLLRTFAISVLLVFGLSLLVPGASARVEGWISRLTARSAGKVAQSSGDRIADGGGFWSGVLIGSGLGLVYAPCAGPILAGVITVSASQDFSTGRLAVALAYGVGSALVFYALMLGGRRLIAPLSRNSQKLQLGFGVVMVVTAVAMFANLDTRFQTAIASDLPSFLVNPTGEIERSEAAKNGLEDLTNRQTAESVGSKQLAAGGSLPVLGDAPQFFPGGQWFNSQPLSIGDLRGKVVLVDFWTYTCINCIRTLPYLRAWYEKYEQDGLEIVGVHSPEFAFEKKAGNVRGAIAQNKLRYPVMQDNDFKTWDAFGNQFWPAKYLIDARGRVRYTHFGEGDYDVTERAIRSLLAEAGSTRLGSEVDVEAETAESFEITPETYIGFDRVDRSEGVKPSRSVTDYGRKPVDLPTSTFRLGGQWRVRDEEGEAGRGAFIDFRVEARRTFLVMRTASGRPAKVDVLLDGKPVSAADAGEDVRNGSLTVDSDRMYRLLDTGRIENHVLTLKPEPGVQLYAFTFG